jgi:hypothetical protein
MNRRMAAMAMAVLLAGGPAAGAESRLERDYQNQYADMRLYGGETDEPSCGGTYLKVFAFGDEVRFMEWNCTTSQRIISRAIYFSRGKAQLVIETSYWRRDKFGRELTQVGRPEYIRRYWLADRTAGPAGDKLRGELRTHASYLLREFRTHRTEWEVRG